MTNSKPHPNLWTSRRAPRNAPTLAQISAAIARIAPPHLAESWDNVGLLSGRPDCPIARVLFTIDITPAVRDEALATGTDLVVSYHPAIFKPISNLRFFAPGSQGQEAPNLAVELACHGVWIYSPHTALDTAPGGTNDVLAAAIGATITGSFSSAPGQGRYLKLVTFIPELSVEKVADALFAAGCGHIGTESQYTRCSFRTPGTGTFQGDASTHPAVGQREKFETVPEIRFETILPAAQAGPVIAALKAAHPYEQPAFDLLQMETPPESVGLGRYATLDKPLTLAALAQRCKKALGVTHAMVTPASPSTKPSRRIRNLALVAGSAGRMGLEQARQPYDCLITGELKHHHMLAYAAAGINAIALGHGNTERPVLKMLQTRLSKEFTNVSWSLSRRDRDPFTIL